MLCLWIGTPAIDQNMNISTANKMNDAELIEAQIRSLIAQMTLAEKIGQMQQVNASSDHVPEYLRDELCAGRIGSVLNQVDVDIVNELQRIAVEDSRLGIPLLVGRDVIHGFKTVLPIPLGQAATWNPHAIAEGARLAAREAASTGVNWTFAPMLDISRDPRWGRIAESLGEDPYLAGKLGVAMVDGFQGDDMDDAGSIAACAKHFAGYGASESGRDYATTNIPENELRNVYLQPFHTAVDAGVASIMTSFSDLNGVPATANEFLLRQVLREEWTFDGFVVSDWDSIRQLSVHGLTANDKDSALEAVTAGVDLEMEGDAYRNHLVPLVEEGRLDMELVDKAVENILRSKFRLGLFDDPYTQPDALPAMADEPAMAVARMIALQSIVMLKNDQDVLPLSVDTLKSLAVIGPLADAAHQQLGTWVFDGDPAQSITGLKAIRELVGEDVDIRYQRVLETSRSKDKTQFEEAVGLATNSDVVIVFLGEEAILSGEAHSRADIGLPGAQVELVEKLRNTGKPVIAVILAGRPLTLSDVVDKVDAILFAWHPGTMGGPAIADLLFGVESPSGKLPVTFPRLVGQIPIYYNQKNTGKPPTPDTTVNIDDINARAPQTSLGMTCFHLDVAYTPLFAFGHGLSYTGFDYSNIRTSASEIRMGEALTISADLVNSGEIAAEEVVQLYVRDLVANVTRPVRELKGFTRVKIQPGQRVTVEFQLHTDELAFYGRNQKKMIEVGDFHVWIGGSSETMLRTEFRIVSKPCDGAV